MAQSTPKPLSSAPAAELAGVEVLFFDIDDTFSTEGRILPEAYNALWKLYRSGVKVVPVTGRPAGWCDFIARMWPVHGVVGENGAFYSWMQEHPRPKLMKKYLESAAVREKNAKKLQSLRKAIHKAFPGAKEPSDQAFREFDLAIDFCEDVARWPDAKVHRLIEFARKKGAMAKLSSIHVNMWFGRYDKLTCVRRVLSQLFSMSPDQDQHKILYVGDSPNDEPFFEKLPLTVGVANVMNFLDRPDPKMDFSPKYVTQAMGGLGFAELAERILEEKNNERRYRSQNETGKEVN